MTAFDTRARSAAERLIERFGRPVTLRRTTRSYDPESGQTSDTDEDVAIIISPPEAFAQSLIDGTLVRAGDLRAHVAAKGLAVTPEPSRDRVLMDGVTYELLRVEPVLSGAETAFFTLHLRR